jgi:tetratricopeptide (TPR) repeat protein
MNQYGVADVERLLRLPRATIRAFVAAGFVTPEKGPRNRWFFSFQDLIVLRTAQTLAATVPARRLTQSLRELRRQLPESMPMTGLAIGAEGAHVIVKEGGARWQAENGQYLLAFDGDPAAGDLNVIERRPRAQPPVRHGWLDEAAALEEDDPEAAMRVYEKALAAQPGLLDAWINLGRLQHEARRFARAEETYRQAMRECGPDPVLLYNLGVLLHDLDRIDEAIAAYEAALAGNPELADCHYNLALLYEERNRPRDAIRHMGRYRTLTARA